MAKRKPKQTGEKMPAMLFYPKDWLQKTARLSAAARAAWIDILCHLHFAETRGELTLSAAAWARNIGQSIPMTQKVLNELLRAKVAHVTFCRSEITVMSSRMIRERKKREADTLRQRKRRASRCSHDNDTLPVSSSSSSSSSKQQKQQRKQLKKEPPPLPSPEGEGTAHDKIIWTKDIGFKNIRDEHRQRWNVNYPACDIDRQLGVMHDWLLANPKRAVKKNYERFVVNWLRREQERGGDERSKKHGAADRRTHGGFGRETAPPGGRKFTKGESINARHDSK